MISKKFSFVLVFIFILTASAVMAASADPVADANNLYKIGKYKEALEIYRKIIATYPGTDWEMMSHLMSARAFEKIAKNEDADDEYKKLITKFPKSGIAEEAFFSLARIRDEKGQPVNAVNSYKAYLKAYPAGKFRVMALFNIASLYKQKGDYKNALLIYADILKSYPGERWFYSWAAIYSGHIYMGKKDYNKAVESYQRVINTSENMFLYSLSMLHRGQAFTENRDYKTAVDIFQQLLKANNYFAEEALYGMGKAHFLNGEFEMAKETFVTLLELFPATVWKQETESKLKTIEKRIKVEREEEAKEAMKAGK